MGVQAALVAARGGRGAAIGRLRDALATGCLVAAAACGAEEPQRSPRAQPPPASTQPQPAPATDAPVAPATAYDALPPRAPLAGVAGFRMVLEVRFAAAPDQPHQLELVQLFPARAYGCLSHQGPAGVARIIELLAGKRGWQIDAGATHAQAASDAVRAELELRAALRAALVLWPDGAAWRLDPATPDRHTTEVTGASGACGRLVVDCAPGAAPTRAAAERLDGTAVEELRAIAWQTHEGRAWPASAELWSQGERVWSETLVSASTRVSFQDEFFRPRLPVQPAPQPLSPAEDGH